MSKGLVELFKKLFGKVLTHMGDQLDSWYSKKIDPKNTSYNRFIKLPYVRYGEGECFYGKCFSLKTRDELLREEEFEKFYKSLNYFSRKKLLKKIINFKINCYNGCDNFLIGLIILFKNIKRKDIDNILVKKQSNNQAVGINSFLNEIKEVKPKLLSKNTKKYLEVWNELQDE